VLAPEAITRAVELCLHSPQNHCFCPMCTPRRGFALTRAAILAAEAALVTALRREAAS